MASDKSFQPIVCNNNNIKSCGISAINDPFHHWSFSSLEVIGKMRKFRICKHKHSLKPTLQFYGTTHFIYLHFNFLVFQANMIFTSWYLMARDACHADLVGTFSFLLWWPLTLTQPWMVTNIWPLFTHTGTLTYPCFILFAY